MSDRAMDKVTEEQAADLLELLQSPASIDHKVAKVNDVKSQIKKFAVHDTCAPFLFEALRIATQSQNPMLSNAGFTSLNHLLSRLSNQESRFVAKEAKNTLPVVIEKLGDHKDKVRDLAAICLTTMWKWAGPDVERAVKNTAMVGKNSRAKEAAMHWLVNVRSPVSFWVLQSLT